MFEGKGCYIWKLRNICDGDVGQILNELIDADVKGVAVKLHNGWSSWGYDTLDMMHFRTLCKDVGITFGIWGYIYIKYSPISEAQKAMEMMEKYLPDFYLIDAEAEAKDQPHRTKQFMDTLKTDIPVGLASYRFPSMHPEIAWQTFREGVDFDSPQVYYRGGDPVANLEKSFNEFANMYPHRLYFPAGDMYSEHGTRPSPEAVTRYLQAVNDHPYIQGTLMWSMDQMSVCPELWEAFAAYEWVLDDEPEEETYHIELTQTEVDALKSITEKLP